MHDGRWEDVNVIAQSSEKYLTFSFCGFCFIDSCHFLTASLDTLAQNLATEGEDKFIFTKQHMGSMSHLFLKKAPYPYDYFDKFEKFSETALPPKEAFYNKLKGEAISDDEYQRARDIWDAYSAKLLKIFTRLI